MKKIVFCFADIEGAIIAIIPTIWTGTKIIKWLFSELKKDLKD